MDLLDKHFGTLLNIGYLSFVAIPTLEALGAAQTGVGAVSLKTSFVGGLIFGLLLEAYKAVMFKNLKCGLTAKNFVCLCQTTLIAAGVLQSLRAITMLKILNIFEGAVQSHARSLSMASGIMLVQAVCHIAHAFLSEHSY